MPILPTNNRVGWSCQIGGVLPQPLRFGADTPMRDAIEEAFRDVTGFENLYLYSGWDGELRGSQATKVARDEITRLRAAGILDKVVELAQTDKLLGIG